MLVKIFFSNPNKYIENQLKTKEHISWNGQANKISKINKLQKLEINISNEELNRRLRSIHTQEYPLFIEINGYKFFYKLIKYIARISAVFHNLSTVCCLVYPHLYSSFQNLNS